MRLLHWKTLNKRIHYEVIVQTEEKDPLILGFKFLAADHAELSSDVDFFLETEDPTDVADALIYVIFPNGVDFFAACSYGGV